MRSGDAPEKWQERAKPATPAPVKPPSIAARIAAFVLFLLFIAGGIGAYVVIGRESHLADTLPLPKALKTVSEAHEDLLLYGRALTEVATEAGARFKGASKQNAPVAKRLQDRLARLHRTGRDLEPRLTREEQRALAAYEQGEKDLQAFLASATRMDGTFDLGDLRLAKAQLQHATDMARGKSLDAIVASKVKKLSNGGSPNGNPVQDVRSASERLRLGAE